VAKSVPVVPAIEDTGLTIMFGNWLIQLSGGTSFGAVMVGTAGAALGTNLINNVPMAVVMISALAGIQHAAPPIQHGFIAATIFGCDLGPNLTGAYRQSHRGIEFLRLLLETFRCEVEMPH